MSTNSDDSAIDEDELLRPIPEEFGINDASNESLILADSLPFCAIDENEPLRNIHGDELGIEVASNESLILADSRPNVGSKRTGSEDSESPNIDNTYNSGCRKKPKLSEVSDENELRLVIIGQTGTGKSATGNTILDKRDFFESKVSGTSVTNKCKLGIATRFKRKLVVVDTPGLQDTEMTAEEVTKEIVKCFGMTAPGIHALLLTVNIGTRFTKEEQETFQHFVQHFGVEIYKYLLVVFTRADYLEDENTDIRNYVKNCPTALKTILDLCDHRYILFNNKRSGNSQEQQVKNLIGSVDEIGCKHGGFCYTYEMFKEAETNLQSREKEAKQKLVEEEQGKVENIKCRRIDQLREQMFDNDRKRHQQIKDLKKEAERRVWEVKDNYRRQMEMMLHDPNRIGNRRRASTCSREGKNCSIM